MGIAHSAGEPLPQDLSGARTGALAWVRNCPVRAPDRSLHGGGATLARYHVAALPPQRTI